ncbi:transposase domain-containing protein [Streptomyces sp. NPDC001276]|uniref:transposase domain-containing protein n=1 Tax=Streptomyces sp. NPDC001276 TaxID=3364555 RepID=UPI003688149D
MYAPGDLGELTKIIGPELVDAVLAGTGVRQQRLRLLPARVVVYFVLALAFFERSSYQAVWAKLTAGLGSVPVAHPCDSSLAHAQRRLGSGPLRHLLSILAGPVADHRQFCAFCQGLRLVDLDVTWCWHCSWFAFEPGSYVRLQGLHETGVSSLHPVRSHLPARSDSVQPFFFGSSASSPSMNCANTACGSGRLNKHPQQTSQRDQFGIPPGYRHSRHTSIMPGP